MYLKKKALWSEWLSTSPECDSPLTEIESPVAELVDALARQSLHREVTLSLRTGLRDARAEFSFLRVRGLRSLLKFLQSVSQSPSTINLFRDAQSITDLQVVPVLFQNSLKQEEDGKVPNLDHLFTVKTTKIISPSTDAEVALALRVLEGCCLLHAESTVLALHYKPIQVLMNILSTRGVLEQGACLDALIPLLLDSPANQMEFKECKGIEEVAELIRNKQVDENLRMKCGEFFLLLIGHVNGRERAFMATIHEDIRRLLGEKSASLIWAASQFGSSLDAEQRLLALHIQARRVLKSLDM